MRVDVAYSERYEMSASANPSVLDHYLGRGRIELACDVAFREMVQVVGQVIMRAERIGQDAAALLHRQRWCRARRCAFATRLARYCARSLVAFISHSSVIDRSSVLSEPAPPPPRPVATYCEP